MDPRSSLSRNTSSNIPQSSYNPNMASGYAMPNYQNNTHLPPINYPPQQMPGGNPNYMPYHRNELPRYNPAPSPVQQGPDRYSQTPTQGPMNSFPPPPNSVLPQPHAQNPPQQPPPPQQQQQQQQQPQQQQQQQQQPQQPQQQQPSYGNQPGGRQVYPQPLAPAPPRANMDPFGAGYGQPGDNRQPAWSGAESMPGMTGDVGRDPTRTHVVGSQGRRGILPSAPGRPPVIMNGTNGSPKSSAIPQKDADGKFPCPNCTKTYLHAKHLKRHMLRHTGDRPYMCVLCNDTFSRSDILKRHFQKCSVRRGNPTGASHLSNPAAHLKKSQAAAAKAAANASPASATTPNSTSGMPSGPYTTTSMPGASLPATTAGITAANMPYAMAANGQNEMQRPGQNQSMPDNNEQSNIDPNAPKSWSMHNARNNPLMYHSNSTSPDHFGMAGGSDEKANVMSNSHHVDNQWNPMPSFGGNEQYMNQMFTPYDQNQNDAKKGYASHEGGSNGYYIPPTSLGADGTLGSPFWNLESSLADSLQNKVDQLVDFCLPLGLQESLQEQQNNFHLRSCLTVDAIKHFVQLYSHYQGHFPWLHMSTFSLFNAYDGLVLAIVCAGAVYSDRISQSQVRALILKVKDGIERTSRLWNRFIGGYALAGSHSTTADYEELQAILICQSLIVWHGGIKERSIALGESRKYTQLVRELDMMVLAPRGTAAFSYLHNLMPGEQADPSQWSWQSWLEQEKRSRLMFMAYLLDAAFNLYFNRTPGFQASEIKLPLPCDDAAWEAPDAEACAKALGLQGSEAQSQVNRAGSFRLKQLEMHHAIAALHDTTINIQPRTTNVYGKFILIHALLVQIWQLQQQRSHSTPGNSPVPYISPYQASDNVAKSIGSALTKWKQTWDDDLTLQYPPRSDSILSPKRSGFCRDGVHFYWLARALLQPNRTHDWQLPAETRFRQVMSGLRKARDWSRTDAASRGEEPGSVADIDDHYETESYELDMRKLFKPLNDAYSSPFTTNHSTPRGLR